ncbi:MAG: tetratricopeptide repeat protein [Chloroflexi bacterium]|nr:tetratricopeptide repeat protein [Chloroflexota bacterium]
MSEPLLERYRAALASGHVALRTGRLDEAASAYREAIELGPDRAVPRRSLGVVCLRLGEPVAALTAFDGALELAPGDDEATLGRAQALVVLRRRCLRCAPPRPRDRAQRSSTATVCGPHRRAARCPG